MGISTNGPLVEGGYQLELWIAYSEWAPWQRVPHGGEHVGEEQWFYPVHVELQDFS